jgi:hypothetical protein
MNTNKEEPAMSVLRVVLLISLLAFNVAGQQKSSQRPAVPPASYPVTVPPAIPFIPPAPYELEDNDNSFWIGTDKLWTARSKNRSLDNGTAQTRARARGAAFNREDFLGERLF